MAATLSCEYYSDCVCGWRYVRLVVTLFPSRLEVGTRGWCSLRREERICKNYRDRVVEDVGHVVMSCTWKRSQDIEGLTILTQ